MKFLKYLLKPVKFLIYIILFVALIYYRPIIFHSNVNQYVDSAISYIENEFNISVPFYPEVVENENIQVLSSSAIECEEIEDLVVDNNNVESKIDSEVTEVVDESKSDETGVSDSVKIAKLDTVNDSKEVVSSEAGQNIEAEHDFLSGLGSIDNKLKALGGLTETVNVINNKVDVLFEKLESDLVLKQQQIRKMEIEARKVVDTQKQLGPVVSDKSIQEKKINTEAVASASPLSDDNITSDSKRILSVARQSFWNGNSDISIKYYLDLARDESVSPDVYGELGNVYYAQGKWKLAGEAYYEAAVRLLDLNKTSQVGFLLRIIQGLDTVSADKLRQKMSG